MKKTIDFLRRGGPIPVVLALVVGLVFGLNQPAAEADKDTPPALAAASGQVAQTVWIDVGPGSRKQGAARKLSESHQRYARQGWTFADFEPYLENGDLEGFWVTYVRVHDPR
ncbi:MAG: hypothetical protein GY856_16085 [bacterium]|nr:hypothetical protein [bacterium]